MSHEGEGVIVWEEIRHREEISPVVRFGSHTTDERERARTSIGDIERDVREILPRPPETDARGECVRLSQEKYEREWEGKEALKEASP